MYKRIILTFIFLFFSLIFIKNDIFAQSCNGSQTCCPVGGIRDECSPIGCNPAVDPICFCDRTCTDVTRACGGAACTTGWLPGDCSYLYGSCVYTPAATPTAIASTPPPATAPPNGACGGCSTCGAANPNECALINGVCSKAGYCGGGTDPTNCGGYIWSNTTAVGPESGSAINLIDYGIGATNPRFSAQVILTSGHTIADVEWTSVNNSPYCFGGAGSCGGARCDNLEAYPGTANVDECNGWGTPPQNALRAYVTATNGGSCSIVADVYARPVCDLTVPATMTLRVGETQILSPGVIASNGYPFGVYATSNNPAIATGPVTGDNTVPYELPITGVSIGSTNLRVVVNLSKHSWRNCVQNVTVNVVEPGPWWQSEEGDVIAKNNLTASIPPTCTAAAGCNPYLSLDGLSGRPGNVLYGNLNAGGLTNGTASSQGWLAGADYSGKTYNYAYFDRLIPTSTIINDLSAVGAAAQADFGGNISPDGYYWYKKTNGTLNINSALDFGNRKVIIFANNVNIRGNIQYNNGSGFLMIVSNGNISLDSSVSEIEGVYVASSAFITGSGNVKLTTRGSVVAWTGVAMQRNLGAVANETQPSYVFEYDPPTMMLFPKSLMQDTLSWKEVQP